MNTEKINFHLPRWNELPNISLYLDQVVTLINETLAPCLFSFSTNDENLILTKNMINNYVKNKVTEPPSKKKYSKTHLAKFLVICILKEVYKISDIQKLINLALEKSSIEIAYDNFCQLFEQALECVFFQKDFVDKSSKNDDKYLLKTVLLSCAYSIYTKEEINKN